MASQDIPKTMKGVVIEKTGGSDVLQYKTDLPVPQPKEGEVLVKLDYIGINYIDTYFRSGLYPVPHWPFTLGREGAGTIVSTGPNPTKPLSVGDKVAYLGNGSYAEYHAIPDKWVSKIPTSISTETGAAAILQGLTAITLIREAHKVNKGDWVLVHAAAGGVGLWLVQLLKAVGAHVIATASTEEKRELARKAGAEVLVDYTKEDFQKKTLEVTGGAGVAAVFDGVGKSTFDASLASVARKGSMISFGNASGAVEPFAIARLAPKALRLMRPQLYGFIDTQEEFDEHIGALWEFLEKNEIDVRIHKVYDLKDAKQAHDDIEGRKTTGKLLLKP